MNVFELSLIVSPLVGAIAGMQATGGGGLWCTLSAAALGLLVGLAIHGAALGLSAILGGAARADRPANPRGVLWFVSLLSIAPPIVAPWMAWAVSSSVARVIFL